MTKYTLTKNTFDQTIIHQQNEDCTIWSFMEDENNPHYQVYLKRDEPKVEHLTEIVPGDE